MNYQRQGIGGTLHHRNPKLCTAGTKDGLGLVSKPHGVARGNWRGIFVMAVAAAAFFGGHALGQSTAQPPPGVPSTTTPRQSIDQTGPASQHIQNPAAGSAPAGSKAQNYSEAPRHRAASVNAAPGAASPGLRAWANLTVAAIRFRGVEASDLDPLPGQLELQPGMKLDAEKVRDSLRRLYSTGLYQTIEVAGTRSGDTVTIIFSGKPRFFIGRVLVNGVKSDRLTSQFINASKLNPGTVYSEAKAEQGVDLIQQSLQENGYYQATVSKSTKVDAPNSQVDVIYEIVQGKQARVGDVKVEGDSGMTVKAFRKKGKLKANSKVNRDTVSRALSRLRKQYQKKQRLEANVNLQSKQYQPPVNHLDYNFGANQGPIVTVEVDGAKMSKGTIKRLIPVYEEGAVDDDLLNEGNRNLRDYYQRQGYFDVKISHDRKVQTPQRSEIDYHVQRGVKHRVTSVTVSGNKYFSTDIIADRLSVHKADIFQRNGLYSQQLVTSDINSITALYQGSGFSNVKITPVVKDTDEAPGGADLKLALLTVDYAIDEGQQQRVGTYAIHGATQVPVATLTPLLNTQVGQPYSSANVSGDRDTILGYYLSHGFDHAEVNVTQQTDSKNAALVNINVNIAEGDQIFVKNVLISGLHYTRPKTVDGLISVHPGDPLDQTALLNTQRRLYDLALFNEVNTAVQNPNGDELKKNVLLQFTEAKRWDINYGFGFEAQTGTPQTNCLNPTTLIQRGINPSTYNCGGKFGVSPAVLFDVTRTNLRGTNQSITIRTAYGTLEQRATATFLNPHVLGLPKFDLSLTGGYISAQDVTTYAASRLEGSFRLTERPNRFNTLIYEFTYRRVKVDQNSIQISPNLIPLYSQPVRVGGPGITWVRDTRDNPLDAHRGTYNTVQDFFAYSAFGSQANFNRIDMTNSSYYAVGKKKWVIARSTRYGQERGFGSGSYLFIPLPEKLYAGGAQSIRGFPINQAGPRDQTTGYPIGGAGVFVNTTELRLPYPTLPYVGNSLGFVLFHDMGNVFNTSSDIWPSFLRVTQPNVQTCKNLTVTPPTTGTESSGNCSFNYFVHDIGLGLRYHTPIGPIRVDFSYTLNPSVYPVFFDYSNSHPVPYVANSGQFNFFFSIGQSF